MTNEESISFLAAVTNDPLYGFQQNKYCVKKQDVVNSIDKVGGFVQITMDKLRSSSRADDMEAHNNIVLTIANFSLQMVVGISSVCAESDNWNSAADELPPVLPLDLYEVLLRNFVSCLQQQRVQLRQKFLNED
jgi:hypothetical protein